MFTDTEYSSSRLSTNVLLAAAAGVENQLFPSKPYTTGIGETGMTWINPGFPFVAKRRPRSVRDTVSGTPLPYSNGRRSPGATNSLNSEEEPEPLPDWSGCYRQVTNSSISGRPAPLAPAGFLELRVLVGFGTKGAKQREQCGADGFAATNNGLRGEA